MADDRVVSAVPACRGRPKIPRVVELLRKAPEWKALLDSGEAMNQADIARREGIPRARATQVIGFLRLAPPIQQHILSTLSIVRQPAITDRELRPMAKLEDPND